jgi:carbamoyltransferase
MILGIYHPARGIGHDSAVALVTPDGEIAAAQSEERFTRIKLDGGYPFRAMDALEGVCGVRPSDITTVAVPYWSTRAKLGDAVHFAGRALRDPSLAWQQGRNRLLGDGFQRGMNQIGAYRYVEDYKEQLRAVRIADGRPDLPDWRHFLAHYGLDRVPLVRVDHQVAHAAGAYYTSGWGEALLITCDGLGALKSGIVATGRAGRIDVIGRTFYPHSAGQFWESITAICGFHHMKHGGKITGLAAHGNPEAAGYGIMREALEHDGLSVRTSLDPARMSRDLAGTPREDIAATAQRRLDEVVTALVQAAARRTGLRRVALAGGVFANVRLNQAIAELPEIDEVFIYPAMGDEGLSLGAALCAAGRLYRIPPRRLTDLYLGPEYTDAEIEAVLREHRLCYQRMDDAGLAARAADLLASGRVVALFRGRMEFGPRALGHRTILYQTTDGTVNTWLNERLCRTEFMPFAPVTLDREAHRCFEGLPSRADAVRFMTITCPCTPWTKDTSPAIVHLDGTARPQVIARDTEPFYYAILEEYYRRTGIPSLINTSFNMHEEPIVCSPDDAVRAFLQGHLDDLVIGPFLVAARREAAAA